MGWPIRDGLSHKNLWFERIVNLKSELANELCYTGIYVL